MPTVDFRLYLVTDRMQTAGRALAALVHEAGDAGLPAVQVRERDLSTRDLLELLALLRRVPGASRPRMLVNDRVDVAVAAGLDGVHLRSDSLPVSVARRLIGPTRLLGASTHSVDDVRQAADEGADFVVLGPIYDTPSKRGYGAPLGLATLERAVRAVSVPVFAIGGMTRERVAEVRKAGAFGVAVISAILSAADVGRETRALLHELHRAL